MTTTPDRTDAFIVVAVADPVLHPEAAHAAAATTRPVVDLTGPEQANELRRYAARAAAVLIDAGFADALAGHRHHEAVFFVTSDRTPMDWEAALRCHAEEAFILPAQAAELLTRLGDLPDPGRSSTTSPAAATCLVVTSSAGGTGGSTFAAALARTAARGQQTPVTLLDADPSSGGLDLLLGVEESPGARWPDLALKETGAGLVDPRDLRAALPSTSDGVAVLSAARTTIDDPFQLTPGHVSQVVTSLSGARGVIIVDLPNMEEMPACDLVVVLVPAEVRPAAAGVRLLKQLRATKTEHVVLSRRRAWSGLEPADLTRILGVEPLADLNTVRSLPRDCEIAGFPQRVPTSLRAAATAVLTSVGVTA